MYFSRVVLSTLPITLLSIFMFLISPGCQVLDAFISQMMLSSSRNSTIHTLQTDF